MKKIMATCIVLIVLVGCSAKADEEAMETYKNDLLVSMDISPYINDDIEILPGTRNKYEGYLFVDYNIRMNTNENFNDLSKDDKYYLLNDIVLTIRTTTTLIGHNGGGSFDCGKKAICDFEGIEIVDGEDTYTMEYEKSRSADSHEMVVNSEEPYKPETQQDKVSVTTGSAFSTGLDQENNQDTGNQDTETIVNNKNGNDWVNLTENQKFHAVSNALYSLEHQGYTILEGEYYYIEALDAFYSDAETKNESVTMALASIGTLSGTINK
ncbi:hypothetical protein ACDX78_23035 [Virgibacillus oceani]